MNKKERALLVFLLLFLPRNQSLMLQMGLRFISFFTKFLIIFLAIFTLSLPHRSQADVDGGNEKTLAMIKPDGVSGNYTNTIKKIILDSGFKIIQEFEAQLDEESVKSFYAEHASKSFFPNLVQYMTSGPVFIMVLEKENAIADWRALIGPTDSHKAKVSHPHSIRAMCGVNAERNCVHGSDSPQSAAREISFFFKSSSSDFAEKHDEL